MKKQKSPARKKATPTPGEKNSPDFAKLRELGMAEMKQAWHAASTSDRVHQPMWLRTLWEKRKEDGTSKAVADLVAIMRRGLASPEIDEPAKASRYLARLIYIVVERFQRAVEGGVMDDVLPRLNALPLLYSDRAGNGAKDWTWANEVFRAKNVGKHAKVVYGRRDPFGNRNFQWRCLAEDAVTTAMDASLQLSQYDELKRRAVAFNEYTYRRLRARYGVSGIFYLLDDESVLLWPHWLEKCRGLPLQVREDIPRYKQACLALAQEFFGDCNNKHSAELLEPLLKNVRKHGQTEGRARMEAASLVAAAVGRLGGEK